VKLTYLDYCTKFTPAASGYYAEEEPVEAGEPF
jgi:hypothetical protein